MSRQKKIAIAASGSVILLSCALILLHSHHKIEIEGVYIDSSNSCATDTPSYLIVQEGRVWSGSLETGTFMYDGLCTSAGAGVYEVRTKLLFVPRLTPVAGGVIIDFGDSGAFWRRLVFEGKVIKDDRSPVSLVKFTKLTLID